MGLGGILNNLRHYFTHFQLMGAHRGFSHAQRWSDKGAFAIDGGISESDLDQVRGGGAGRVSGRGGATSRACLSIHQVESHQSGQRGVEWDETASGGQVFIIGGLVLAIRRRGPTRYDFEKTDYALFSTPGDEILRGWKRRRRSSSCLRLANEQDRTWSSLLISPSAKLFRRARSRTHLRRRTNFSTVERSRQLERACSTALNRLRPLISLF